NGSLMRTAPIGVFFASHNEKRRRASLADSAITHFDPRCQLACACMNAAIAAAVRESACDIENMLESAEAELPLGAHELMPLIPQETELALVSLERDLSAARRDDPELYGPELHLESQQGFVRVAFRLAFWELLHAPTFEAALVDVVNRGGDADTNAAIAGALLGAFHGEGGISPDWIAPVPSAPPQTPLSH